VSTGMSCAEKRDCVFQPVFSFCIFMLVMVVIGFWNRYIFISSNLRFLLLVILCYVFCFGPLRFPRKLIFSDVTFFMLIFILYMFARLGDGVILFDTNTSVERIEVGLKSITNQLLCYGLFIVSALLYYNKGRLSLALWLIFGGYILAFIFRASLLQGFGVPMFYSNSPGFMIFPFLAFLFLLEKKRGIVFRIVPHLIFFFCAWWLLLLGSRGTFGAVLVFYLSFIMWPRIIKNRIVYLSLFWCVLGMILISMWIYTHIMMAGEGEWIGEMSQVIFRKGATLRYLLWKELVVLASERPAWGFGTGFASASIVIPDWITLNRDTLSSGTTYVELLLRLGIVGFTIHILIFYRIWKSFWRGKDQISVRVAGAFLAAISFYLVGREYMIFTAPLWSGFGWILLGIGMGGSFRTHKRLQQECAGCEES